MAQAHLELTAVLPHQRLQPGTTDVHLAQSRAAQLSFTAANTREIESGNGGAPALELLGLQGGSALCWRKLCTPRQPESKKKGEEGAGTLGHSLRA